VKKRYFFKYIFSIIGIFIINPLKLLKINTKHNIDYDMWYPLSSYIRENKIESSTKKLRVIWTRKVEREIKEMYGLSMKEAIQGLDI